MTSRGDISCSRYPDGMYNRLVTELQNIDPFSKGISETALILINMGFSQNIYLTRILGLEHI
jgi:hypothetical protein